MNLQYLDQFKTTNESGFYKNIPIEKLSEVKQFFKDQGIKVRIRYRGKRLDGMRLTCLKENAKRFSIYIEGKSNRYFMTNEDRDDLTHTATMQALSYIQDKIYTTSKSQLSPTDIATIESILGRYIFSQIQHKHGQFKGE